MVAPAMNTFMYKNIFTAKQTEIMQGLGVRVLNTQEKQLACGDIGIILYCF